MIQEVRIIQKVKDILVPSKKRHKLIVGGRGKGASWSIARYFLLRGMREPLFIPCVREIQKTIKYSVKKLLDDTIKDLHFEWFYDSLQTEIKGKNNTLFAFFGLQDFNADNIKSLEGADLCWVAEAQSLSRNSIMILRPTIRKLGSEIWWDFNQRYETDPVYVDYVLHDDPNAEVLHLNWRDNPWFNETLRMEKDSDYKRNEVEARHIWEGELRNAGDKFVCPSELVDVARNNDLEPGDDYCVGADIAHQGGDEIIFYMRRGPKVIAEYQSRYQGTLETVSDLIAFSIDTSVPLNIDNGDIGKAVADLMDAKGFDVSRINFGGVPEDAEHYEDCVTEMYFNLRDLFPFIDIPPDEELRNQLIQRKYDYISGRRGYEVMKIESKEKFKTHAVAINASPDRADALGLCFYRMGGIGSIQGLSHNIFS